MILIPNHGESCDDLRLRALAALLPGDVAQTRDGRFKTFVKRDEALLPDGDDKSTVMAGTLRETLGRDGRLTMIEVVPS